MDNIYEENGKLDKTAISIDLEQANADHAYRLLEAEKVYSKELARILNKVVEEP